MKPRPKGRALVLGSTCPTLSQHTPGKRQTLTFRQNPTSLGGRLKRRPADPRVVLIEKASGVLLVVYPATDFPPSVSRKRGRRVPKPLVCQHVSQSSAARHIPHGVKVRRDRAGATLAKSVAIRRRELEGKWRPHPVPRRQPFQYFTFPSGLVEVFQPSRGMREEVLSPSFISAPPIFGNTQLVSLLIGIL